MNELAFVCSELVVIAEASEKVSVELNLSYLVNRVKWTPRYDVRVYAAESLLKLFYYGVVQQATGEDWLDAPITLCTAQPAIGGAVPELLVQKIGFKSKSAYVSSSHFLLPFQSHFPF